MNKPYVLHEEVTKILPVPLTTEALEVATNQLTGTISAIESLEEDLAVYSKNERDKIKGLKREMHRLNTIVASKAEEQEVQCKQVVSSDHERVDLVRLDTNETISSRELTDEEKQLVLFPDRAEL